MRIDPVHDALIVVDLQRDFLPGGALAVPRGGEVVRPLNLWLERFSCRGLPVFATRDWHPPRHCSFRAQGGPWPAHCVAGTPGAAFPAALRLPPGTVVVSKAASPQRDAYSGFDGTELDMLLKARGVQRLFVGGLATDYCVLRTVEDALARGYDVLVLTDAVRPVDVNPGDGERALRRMRSLGAAMIESDAIR